MKLAVISRYCKWQPKPARIATRSIAGGIKIKRNTKISSGSINLTFAVLIFIVVAGLFYLYSTNSNAVQGYQIKNIEKELSNLKNDNEKLRIKEAELKSLYRIEESTKNLNMEETKIVSYVEEQGPVA
jgi:hypothetical protein